MLRRDGYLCQCDDCQGGKKRVTLAQEVDHRTPRAWFLDGRATGDPDALDNLRAVSSSCHRKISLAQRGFRRRPRVDVNGWPVASIYKALALGATSNEGRSSVFDARYVDDHQARLTMGWFFNNTDEISADFHAAGAAINENSMRPRTIVRTRDW